MALIVVGGQAKHVGKTTLVCDVIRHFADARWLAAKITPHFHAQQQPVLSSGSGWIICEQHAADLDVDTGRYLAAGAVRSLLICAELRSLSDACAALKKEVVASPNAIVESTSAAHLLAPDVFILVVNPDDQQIKPSAREQLALADAVVVTSKAQGNSKTEYPEHLARFQMYESGIDAGLATMLKRLLRIPGS